MAERIIYLSDAQLESLGISPNEIADSIEAAFQTQSEGKLWTVPKSALLPGDGRYMMATLSAADNPQYTIIKTAMVSPRNPARGLNGIEASIILLDSETGLLKAAMGGNWITAVRTAGLSVVMARRLADPDSRSVAFVGCGVQARSHLDAFNDLFPLAQIRMFGRGQANLDKLAQRAAELGLEAIACPTAREAIEGADLVVSSITLSYDTQPFLDANWMKPGAFAAITDLAIPWLPNSLKAFQSAFIDDHEQEASSPKPMIEEHLISGDMAQVLSGDREARHDPQKRSAFLFRGLAIGDFAAAALAYDKAMEQGDGHRFQS
ncbi:MAG: ornithine cyclodeaminase family protein [Rhizobiaceae bacterium]